MHSFEVLSEILIETLKEFSAEKRKLTVDSLRDALVTKKELFPILVQDEDANSSASDLPEGAPSRTVLSRVPLRKYPSDDSSDIPRTRATYAKILAELAPISKGEHANRLTALQQQIQNCKTPEDLAAGGDGLVAMTGLLVTRIVDEVQYANDFLVELSEDLVGMEQQLFTYQSHNRETFLLNDKFCSNILSHTEEMNKAAAKEFKGTGSLIASKLSALGKVITLKRQEDQARLHEADSKIAELQMSVHTYNEEIHQVTERANALEKEILVDALTEINNRRAYELEINDSFKRFNRDGQPFSLVLIDVDKFKNVNDLYGHHAGDKCLREISKKIRGTLRKSDFLARYGGEELIAILKGSNAGDAKNVAEKIRSRIEQTRFCYMDEEIPVTISLGVTEVRPTDISPEIPFIRVDEAMYRAKREGRNRVCMV